MKYNKDKYKQIKREDILKAKKNSIGHIYHYIYDPKGKDYQRLFL